MKTFAQKIKAERTKRNMTQTELGKLLGVSQRMILEYETAGRKPHRARLKEFAEILEVPYEYLLDDRYDTVLSVFNGNVGENDEVIEEIPEPTPLPKSEIEARAMREVAFLKERSAALFAGGELPQESKDAFFHSLYEAYLKCREAAVKDGTDVDSYQY